jgi:hypothetical protein
MMSPMTKLESDFQAALIVELRELFPGCYIQKNNPTRLRQQGVPDLLILWNEHWAILECKRSAHETPRPNQPYYVEQFNEMSFAAFIYPENREEVLHALATAFGAER